MTIEHLPDAETTHESVDQVNAYIAGCDQRVEDARQRYAHDLTLESMEAFTAAVAHARKARLNAYGVECPNEHCENGLVSIPERDRTKPASVECPCCGGESWVLPEEADAWTGERPEPDYDDLLDRMYDR